VTEGGVGLPRGVCVRLERMRQLVEHVGLEAS
jgi:hypothetical protein